MNHRQELEVALAEAKAQLAEAVETRARLDVDSTEADARIEKARVQCRLARAALTGLDRAELEPAVTVGEPGEQTGPSVRGARKRSGRPRGKAIHRLIAGVLSWEVVGRGRTNWRLIARQAFMLLALVLAYLQYYFFDVQLQVARLPSLAVRLLSVYYSPFT